jgi:periplasmic glucans biosynthesis protein
MRFTILLAMLILPALVRAQQKPSPEQPFPEQPFPEQPFPEQPFPSQPFPSQQSTLFYAQVHTLDDLDRLAARTAAVDFVPKSPIDSSLAALVYSDYVKIGFRYENATWWGSDSPFWIETFHPGFVQRENVMLFAREDGFNRLIPFSTDDFNYDIDDLDVAKLSGSGHAGIKIAGKFPGGATQEMLTFLGSSYFRGRSEHTIYGASARGLAVDIALNKDEEFPFFRAFWVHQPDDDDKSVRVLALMDSPSVAGAYQFDLTPGLVTTSIDVTASLHFRRVPEKIGLAPLTSMWIWGDGLDGPPKDARPSVHDSDGLLIRTKGGRSDGGDDWLWRAFARQSYPSVSRFAVDRLAGFGVMQRNTAFFHFDDHNAQYHKRPSVFVTPTKGWPAGQIELLEIPGEHEGVDNIGAYWIPNESVSTDQPLKFSYRVDIFGGQHPDEKNVARATNFQIDRPDKKGEPIEMTIRFAGGPIANLPADATVEVAIATIRGEAKKKSLEKTETGDWLLTLDVTATEDAPVELTVALRHEGQAVTETFAYLCPPSEPSFVYPDVYTR